MSHPRPKRPRLIIIVRHGESEANCDRTVNNVVPNHLVALTRQGHAQATEAGQKIADLIREDESVMIYRSPYMRTRQTEVCIRAELYKRGIKPRLREEPRIREQDFGNFQDHELMDGIMAERHRYGAFFYRIQNGESAADVFDRCASFCGSMYRHFEYYGPDVVILVTHGIFGRVFLMKWFNWDYEYFENLKNLAYCQLVVMEKEEYGNKYELLSRLEHWDEMIEPEALATASISSF